ncbi:ABC transporter permease [Curvibacter sp. CHRR-16]|uniref:ABC transporter permease n=1 Tax=Curvibacter sp. CHRR-16 TaxID=2835872 RepID=UPI001BD976E2|nr:ABC transporter permease [Curvibacter sp. CHRR-16]MBT0569763.1 ABC transporter permease [Curvibacter sp. CHRR-16]
MLMFILRRTLATIPVLVVVALIVFIMLHLAPGDPAALIVGDSGTVQDIAHMREQLGLNDPLPLQFAHWFGRLLQGDLGHSLFIQQSVTSLIAQRIGPTVSLAVLTLGFTLALAIPLGTIAAWKRNSWLDRSLMAASALGFSVPAFVVGYALIWLFGLQLRWFPVQGYTPASQSIGGWLHGLILPALTLSFVYVALIARVTRAAVSEALTEDYIRTARAKGISEWRVLTRHALANAAVPIATVVGIGIALLITGVVVTETVFAIPGLGRLTVESVLARDFPLIQGVTLFFSFVYVVVNLLVDLSYLLLDPRIRY